MNRYQKIKSLFLLLFVTVSAKAQIENGKVYSFVNVGNSTQSLVIGLNNNVVIAPTNVEDKNQLWLAEGTNSSFMLRNLGNGYYLRSSNATSAKWTMVKEVDGNCWFDCSTAGSGYAFRATNTDGDSHYMHYGANQGTVVCWSTDATATQWIIEEVTGISNETLINNWNELQSVDPSAATVATYQEYLETLFSDKACTTLRDTYASMSETTLKSQTAYKNLSAVLQQMVLKVRNNNWGESNYDANKSFWDADYAKKYRVQLYEPYNEPEAAAKALGINAHTNLNNPTGIFANSREALYVMVEGTIKEGSSLYIASYAGNGEPGGYAEGVELKEGLNVIPSFTEGNNYVVNYVVHTFDTSKGKGDKAKARRLSEYPDLKIHIEGGHINGYWNKMGDDLYTPDTRSDWNYIEERATQTTVTILGEYITLQFPLRDEDAVENNGTQHRGMAYYLDKVDVRRVIDEWDNIMMWQRFLLGVLDETTTKDTEKNAVSPYSEGKLVVDYIGDDAYGYSDYYNVHGLSLGVGYNYMFGGWSHCGYNYNTMQSIIVDMLTSAGSHWGPGHEIGHQHQSLLNLNGLTEVTNNLFSNVVLWYFGETTSRVNGDEGSLSNVLAAFNAEGSDFYTNNIWGQTHMYYKLFLYYHVLGHNPKFYPRLFEMLRQDPMINGGQINGATSLLHFYKKCCLASGDDLTEFFRAYGFFRVMNNRLVGDYSNATYNMSQKDIDEAIAEVKTWGYDENVAVLFINDATGETIKSHKGGNLEKYGETTICAEVGCYASFADATITDYTYNMVGNTVTMIGEGGIGFAVFNEKNELIGFSDKKTFPISEVCAAAVVADKASIMVVKGDNTLVPAVDVMDANDSETKYAALGELLTTTADLLAFSDADNSKPGFYKASVMQTLQQLYTEAQSVYDNKVVASYATAYAALVQEYTRIATLETDKTPFLPGSTYVLTNKKYPTTAMTLSDNGMMCVYNSSSSAQQWTFEATDEKDTYYLKNVGGSYLGSLLESTQVGVTTKETASRYKLFDLGKGLWALQCQNDSEELQSLHCNSSYKIVGWSHTSTDNDGSWWYLTATAKDESMLPLYDLQNLIAKTEDLVDRLGEITTTQAEPVTLTANNYYTNAECKDLTYGDQFTSYSVLCDNNSATFLHTDYSDQAPDEDHYVRIDLGNDNKLTYFNLSYTTRKTGNIVAPTKLAIEASHDALSWVTLREVTSGLSTAGDATNTLEGLGNGTAYRYIRMRVFENSTGQQANNRYYFIVSELGLSEVAFAENLNLPIPEGILLAAYKSMLSAQGVVETATTTEEYTDAYNALSAEYERLLAAYNDVNNAELVAKRDELFRLIASTNELISTCGMVTIGENRALTLSTSSGVGDGRLTQWTSGSSEGSLANLYDGNVNTCYVSNWNHVNADPYLEVQLNDGVGLNKFTFTFTGRDSGNSPTPSEIVVSGSDNGGSYTNIATFTKDDTWPMAANEQSITPKKWTSPTITTTTAYKYLRFTVTKSERNNPAPTNYYGRYHYGISEFGVDQVSETTITLSPEHGEADEVLLLATYNAVNDAQVIYDWATATEEQLQNAIEELNAAKEALYNAMYPSVEYTIQVVGANAGGVIYKEVEYISTLSAPVSLSVDELVAIEPLGYVAKSVTMNGRTIIVMYNKVYTVSIVGGEGNGCVTYDDTEYVDNDSFDAEQGSFTKEALIAKVVDGYNSEVSVNHDLGVVGVIYTLDKTAFVTLKTVTEEFIASCYTDGELNYFNSQYVTETWIADIRKTIVLAQTQCDNATTLKEYNAAWLALKGVKERLESNIALANTEASERSEKREILNVLIGDANTLITRCEENPGDATIELIDEISAIVNFAQVVANNIGSTKEALMEATETLQAKYNVLNAAQQSTIKADLLKLIEQAETLIAECGTYGYDEREVKTPVVLQVSDANANYWLSTNADQNVVGNRPDGDGIAALIDGTVDTYMHTQWGGTAVDDDHYVQVNLGEGLGLAEFSFTYAIRNVDNPSYNSPAPSVIEVYGSTDDNDFTTLLATFPSDNPDNALPSYREAGKYWTSAAITSNTDYEYLRFYVRGSDGPGNKQYGNHYFFAMSEFALTAISHETFYYVEALTSPGDVTDELLLNVAKAKDIAKVLADNSYDKNALEKQKVSLQAAYDALEAAHGYTTSINHEVTEEAAVIYDLYGRRLRGIPTSGLYIINGVKRYIQVK